MFESVKEYFHPVEDTTDYKAARALGWASIAVGLTEILAPRQLQRTMGISNGQNSGGENTGIFRVCGVREIMQGVDILTHDDPTPGMIARVAGDMIDGVLLAGAGAKSKRPAGFASILAAVMGIVAADFIVAPRLWSKRR